MVELPQSALLSPTRDSARPAETMRFSDLVRGGEARLSQNAVEVAGLVRRAVSPYAWNATGIERVAVPFRRQAWLIAFPLAGVAERGTSGWALKR